LFPEAGKKNQDKVVCGGRGGRGGRKKVPGVIMSEKINNTVKMDVNGRLE